MTKDSNQNGFSIIELLLVLVIVGILATLGVPSFSKAREAAEKGATIAVLRTMHSQQTSYLTEKGRYARLNELNSYSGNSLGTTSTTRIVRGNYMFLMSPNPTLSSLRTRYRIIVYKSTRGFYTPAFLMQEDGVIHSIIP